MRTARYPALYLVLSSCRGLRGRQARHGHHRYRIYGSSVLWKPTHQRGVESDIPYRHRAGESPDTHAHNGYLRALPEEKPQSRKRATHDLSIPPSESCHRKAESGLEYRYHVHTAQGRLRLPHSRHIDWYSRYVISWKVSNTLEMDFCLECLKEALSTGTPDIFNTDQGSHFTSPRFTDILEANGIKISMDGRGCYLDNIFIERLWRSVKQENIYLSSYVDVLETRLGLQEYFSFYNTKRRHQSLAYKTPQELFNSAR